MGLEIELNKYLDVVSGSEGECFSNLSHEELAELWDIYREKGARAVSDKYPSMNASQVYSNLPDYSTSYECPYCRDASCDFVIGKPGRFYSGGKWESRYAELRCSNCGHDLLKWNCSCEQCQAHRASAEDFVNAWKTRAIRDHYGHQRPPVDYSELDLNQKVVLLALVRDISDESMDYLDARLHASCKIAPNQSFLTDSIRSLSQSGVIVVDPNLSSLDSFSWDGLSPGEELEDGLSYYIYKVSYRTNVSIGEREAALTLLETKELLEQDLSETAYGIEEVRELWRTIGLQEAIEFSSHLLSERGFNFEGKGKALESLKRGVQLLPLGLVFFIIYCTAKNISDFYQSGKASGRNHAVNIFPGNVEKMIDKCIGGIINPRPFRRNFDCEQSTISQIFFNKVVSIGEAYLEKTPDSFESI